VVVAMSDSIRVLMNLRRWLLLAVLALFAPLPVLAAESTALDGYLGGLTTWSGDFTQAVQDTKGKRVGTGRGKLVIVRPGKFRWESSPEGAADAVQLLIADGRNLWFLDRDLDQATVKPLSEALPQSPAMLLAGGADLRAAFNVQANGKRDGFDWVRALPKDAASDFREALFGFQGGELARLIIVDKLGQRSTLSFTNVKRNAPVAASATEFQLPQGVDLIGKPVAP
jgi:outer membrane lipoprotein carrier protein